MPFGRQAVGIAEMGLPTTQLFGFFVHPVCKLQYAAGNILRHHNRSPVVRFHHHFPHQFAGKQPLPTLHLQVGIIRRRRSLRDFKLCIQSFSFQAQYAGHHLGQACRCTPCICIFFKNDTAGLGVDQYRGLRQHRGRGKYLPGVEDDKSYGKH